MKLGTDRVRQATIKHLLSSKTKVQISSISSMSVNLVQVFSCTSFLHAIAHSSVPGQKLSGTRLKSCDVIGRPVVIVFVVISFGCFRDIFI